MSDHNYKLDELPELPLEAFQLGGTLEHARSAPVLTIEPPKPVLPDEPVGPTPTIKRAQVFTRKYLTQVLYPRVICYPFGELSDQLVFKTTIVRENENNLEARARQEQFYKLTSHKGVALTPP